MSRHSLFSKFSLQNPIRQLKTTRSRTLVGVPHSRRLRIEPLEDRRLLAVFTVTNLNDLPVFGPGSAPGTLRQALFDANQTAAADTIQFAPALTAGGPATILLTNNELTISRSVNINGPGSHLLTIDASGNDFSPANGTGSRVFFINDNTGGLIDVDIVGLKLTGGDASGHGGAISVVENLDLVDTLITGNYASMTGGGVSQYLGTFTITNSTISGNTANQGGGIFHNQGNLTIATSLITGNSAVDGGGMASNGTTAILDSTFSGNSATYGGGISHNPGNLSITRSTFSGNTAKQGGGILSETLLGTNQTTILSSTFSGNIATASGVGGGVFNGAGKTVIQHSTFTGNLAPTNAGGGVTTRSNAGSEVHVESSIISANLGGDVVYIDGMTNNFTSLGYNLVGTGNGVAGKFTVPNHDIISSTPKLGLLVNNGGRTKTHALLDGSPAIDLGNSAILFNPAVFDQRGAPFVRVYNSGGGTRIDIGAYERQTVAGLSLLVDTLVDESDGNYSAGDLSLREAVGLANGSIGANTITFSPALNGGTIDLDQNLGEMGVDDSLTIDASGLSAGLTIDAGNGTDHLFATGDGIRIFYLDDGLGADTIDVDLIGLTFIGGDVDTDGGAIRSREILTVVDCTISGNAATGSGAGIYDINGTSTITDSVISGNRTTGTYGRGAIIASGNVVLTRSTVSGNSTLGSMGSGGGLYVIGSLTVIDSTISGNSTLGSLGRGGGLYVNGSLTVIDSTISGNSTQGSGAWGGGFTAFSASLTGSTVSGNTTQGQDADGGGFSVPYNISISHSTITDNHAYGASAIGGGFWNSTGHVDISHSILAGNTAAAAPEMLPGFGLLSADYSLISNKSGTSLAEAPIGSPDGNGNLIGGSMFGVINPLLATLADNGGPTLTRLPMPGSPVIDAGDPTFTPPPAFDQRGDPYNRVSGPRVDMGAVELQPGLFGDYNQNDIVDAADYTVWRDTLTAGGSVLPNDPTPGVVNESDFLYWRTHFGETLGAGSGSISNRESSADRLQSIALPAKLVVPVTDSIVEFALASPTSASAANAPISLPSLAASGRTTLRSTVRISLPNAPAPRDAARQDALLLAWVTAAVEAPPAPAADDAGGGLADRPADETAGSLCDSIDTVFETLASGRDEIY